MLGQVISTRPPETPHQGIPVKKAKMAKTGEEEGTTGTYEKDSLALFPERGGKERTTSSRRSHLTKRNHLPLLKSFS